MIKTLRTLIAEHPDWLDYPLVVYCPDGHYDYVGAAGSVYLHDEMTDEQGNPTDEKVVVFSAN